MLKPLPPLFGAGPGSDLETRMTNFDLYLGGCLIRIKTNGTESIIGDYVSAKISSPDSKPFCTIMVIVAGAERTETDVLSDKKAFRSDWAHDGYYAGRYYGDKILFRKIGATYLVIGANPSKFVWRYLIKYILADFARRNGLLYFKAACISFKNKGCLVFGLSKSGKTTLVQALVSLGAEFVSNTTTFLDPISMLATGVHANVRVRGNGYKETQGPEPSDLEESMRPVEDVFPLGRVREQALISSILFIQRRRDEADQLVGVGPDDCAELLANLFIGERYYDLQHDVIEDDDMSLLDYSNYSKDIEARCRSVSRRVNAYYLPLSHISRETLDAVTSRIWGKGSADPFTSAPEDGRQLGGGDAPLQPGSE